MTTEATAREVKRGLQKGLEGGAEVVESTIEATADITTAALRGNGDVVGEATSVRDQTKYRDDSRRPSRSEKLLWS